MRVILPCILLLAVATAYSPGAENDIAFIDILRESGIRFRHVGGASDEKYLIETMGAGCALLDYDGDGRLDIFFVNSGYTRAAERSRPVRHALYRNNGDGTFTDITARAGVGGNGAYGMGVAVGDFDNNGYPDIFITYYGPNQLYRNNGDGTFTDVTATAGVGDPHWGASAAWLDYDRDGRLDLYVTNYLDFSYEKNPYCGERDRGIRSYCHPDLYNGVPDLLYRNNGDGTFTESGRKAGIASIEGKGLGVVAGDFDGDGWIDIYVANDSVRNSLFRNNQDGTFTDLGLTSGSGYDDNGKPQAGMGTDMADYDGDGLPDLFVTNLDTEYNTLYRNLGRNFFQDVTIATGLGSELSTFNVGFGALFIDYDNDGWKDLFVVNGHIIDNIALTKPHMRHAQPKLLYRNDGKGRFTELTTNAGSALLALHVSRGLAAGDIDNDGDLDLIVSGCNEAPQILRNNGGNRRNSLSLRFEGKRSNRDGVGVRVKYELEGRTIHDQLFGGRSYLSASDAVIFVGMGAAAEIRNIEVQWPSGEVRKIDSLRAGGTYKLKEDSSEPPVRTP